MLSPFEQRLQVVRRWGIISTIRQQSVAEHSFNVAIIADRVAREWFDIKDPLLLYELGRAALLHDQFEVFTNDIPTPTKKALVRNGYSTALADASTHFVLHVSEHVPELGMNCAAALKIADYIEAMLFLAEEERLGNRSLREVYNDVRYNLLSFLVQIDKKDKMEQVDMIMLGAVNYQQDPLRIVL